MLVGQKNSIGQFQNPFRNRSRHLLATTQLCLCANVAFLSDGDETNLLDKNDVFGPAAIRIYWARRCN